ncbi:LPP20 family lipoprotein [Gemmatimonadales bacterium]|nr:LPP20 family lipoprotein [Gemmatimonadales bacterium]
MRHYKFSSIFLVLIALGCGGSGNVDRVEPMTVANVPSWYTNPPNERGPVGVGDAVSRNMGIARRQAIALARAEIATEIEARADVLIELSASNIGSSDPVDTQFFEETIKQAVIGVELYGVRTDSVAVTENLDGPGFRVYALVVQDLAMANERVLDEIRKEEALYAEFRATRAFERLNQEICQADPSRCPPGGF